MRSITISDIRKRVHSLTTLNPANNSYVIEQVRPSMTKSRRVSDTKRIIENIVKGDKEFPFYNILEMYESIFDKAPISEIRKVGLMLTEDAVVRTRDCKSLQTLLKRRLTHMHNKGMPKSVEVENGATINKGTIATIQQQQQAQELASSEKDSTIFEAYNNMLEKAIIYNNCDRVIENYNRISKRFNLEVLINENTKINGVNDTVAELCRRIDTYVMPTAVKFNTVIETAFYGFESNAIEYKKSEILETAVDYFLFKEDGKQACKEILEATLFFDKNTDMKDVDIFTETDPEEENNNIDSILQNHYSNNEITEPLKETAEFEEIFKKFKETELNGDKPENKLKGLINKLYSPSVSSITDNTPDLLKWIRTFFIVGSAAIPMIGPVIMAVSYIADKFISLHVDREEVAKMVKCFEKEIKASNKKMASTTDQDEKERLKKYIDALTEALKRIQVRYNSLFTDEEHDRMFEDELSNIDIDSFNGDTSDFFDDDEDDFDFEDFAEGALMLRMERTATRLSDLCNTNPITENMIYHLVEKADDELLLNIANISAMYPEVFFKETLRESISNSLINIRKNDIKFESTIDRSIRISTLHQALSILENTKPIEQAKTIIEGIIEAYGLYEIVGGISIIHNSFNEKNNNFIMEASINNSLKLASMKIRKGLNTLKDKEKQLSKNIDASVNNIKKGVENALTNDNREAIIKGRILPSASKVIKMGILNAGLAIINPVLSIIATLGYIGVSSKFKAKERQMVIDEIEIELKMCEKYIAIAESKNDMKALKQLLQIQRDLERQLQRIKYKMAVDFKQKVYDTKSVDSN